MLMFWIFYIVRPSPYGRYIKCSVCNKNEQIIRDYKIAITGGAVLLFVTSGYELWPVFHMI